ncbi:MAG: hypothetical protein APF78_00900 [Sphingomonadales bacterium BRH_c3]|nr:MAG: hypothetical protein APF78_00900 [Sphingomonadales bacterium BRH_c3]
MRFALAAAAVAIALHAPVSAKDYAPRDECGDIAGAQEFRIALAAAVTERSEERLLPLFAGDAILDFGGGSGRDLLRERLDDPDYGLWEALESLLQLGCAKGPAEEGSIVMPWLWAQDLGEDDAFSVLYVIGQDVPVYRDATGPEIIDNLSWDLVGWSAYLEQAEEEQSATRAKVVLEGGAIGYIARNKLRPLLDYRLLAEPAKDGKLLVTAFIAGD